MVLNAVRSQLLFTLLLALFWGAASLQLAKQSPFSICRRTRLLMSADGRPSVNGEVTPPRPSGVMQKAKIRKKLVRNTQTQKDVNTNVNVGAGSVPTDADIDAPIRKKHKNKYANFSKSKKLDPIEQTKKRNDEEMKLSSIDVSAAVRGTTVPTISGSPKLGKDSKRAQFTGYTNIVPSDPYTFGYVLPHETDTAILSHSGGGYTKYLVFISMYVALRSHVRPLTHTIRHAHHTSHRYIEIGRVGIPHGVKGELKVTMETDFADIRLESGSMLYVKRPNRLSPRPVRIMRARKQGGPMSSTYVNL